MRSRLARPLGVGGAMIAYLIPVLIEWSRLPDGLVSAPSNVPDVVQWGLVLMAIGVFVSGARDLYAALELPGGGWPWQ